MKNLILASLAVILMICIGVLGMNQKLSFGPFFMFIGVCTSIGLVLDIVNVIKTRLRKQHLKKFGLGR